MQLWINLVVQGKVTLSAVPEVLKIISNALGLGLPSVCFTTGRNWILRRGLGALFDPLESAFDWIWITDHSIQMGRTKLLLIVGVRASRLPPIGQALSASDLSLIHLEPMEPSNSQKVHAAIQQAAKRAGRPLAIVSDHGADLLGGIRLWIADHPATKEIYDIAHRAAIILKGRLEADPRWSKFVAEITLARKKMYQTELAGLAPPRLREKARFMNLAPVISWGISKLFLLQQNQLLLPSATEELSASTLDLNKDLRVGVKPLRLEEMLGWLKEFHPALREWAEWMEIIGTTLQTIRLQGYTPTTPEDLASQFRLPMQFPSSDAVARQLHSFVLATSESLGHHTRIPGSSEVLESLFGKFKSLEGQQSQGGFTSLVLALGTLVGNITDTATETFNEIMARVTTKNIKHWVTTNLGMTIPAQRRAAALAVQ